MMLTVPHLEGQLHLPTVLSCPSPLLEKDLRRKDITLNVHQDFNYRNSICWLAALRAGNQEAKKAIIATVEPTKIKSANCNFTGK